MKEQMKVIFKEWGDRVLEFIPSILLSLVLLWVGFKLINLLCRQVEKVLSRRETDLALQSFLKSSLSLSLKVALVISLASYLGIKTTSFIALLGSAGLAVGLALQGSLSNFAGGVMILFFRPFKVGDFIDAQGFKGTVRAITVFHTFLTTPDNKKIILPNGALANGPITNASAELNRRVDLVFSIGYSDNVDVAKKIILELAQQDKRILSEPQSVVLVNELAANSVNLVLRAWTRREDYWDVYHDLLHDVKQAFDREGISIPFPQREIHVYNKS